MLCIYCGGNTQVTNSRPQKRSNTIWRRRQCSLCQNIFTTREAADYARSWVFLSSDGSLQPFVHEKLFLSLYDSLRHRPTALDDATALTGTVISKLLPQISNAKLLRNQVIQTASLVLQNFDQAAHVHYQAFHHL